MSTGSLAAGVDAAVRLASDLDLGDPDVRTILAQRLYRSWYAGPVGPDPGALPASSPPLPGLLRTAHAGSRQWEDGWSTHRALAGSVVVAGRAQGRSGRRVVGRGDWVAEGVRTAGLVPSTGDALRVCGRQDLLGDGWWCTWGGGWVMKPRPDGSLAGTGSDVPLLRLYLAPYVDAVADVVAALTAATISWDRPWMLKAAADPDAYRRADAVVLYVPRPCSWAVARELRPLVGGLAASLRTAQPPLTLAVARGVAAAEDPAGEHSFGEHRCAAIVRAVVDHPDDPLAAVGACLLEVGVDPLAPYRSHPASNGAGPDWSPPDSPSLVTEEDVPWDTWWT